MLAVTHDQLSVQHKELDIYKEKAHEAEEASKLAAAQVLAITEEANKTRAEITS